MTDEYKNSIFARISKLNFTGHLYLKKTASLWALCLVSFFCGYLLHLLPVNSKDTIYDIMYLHFCGFYEDLGLWESAKATVYFALADIIPIFSAAVLGYTMFSGFAGKLILLIHGITIGWCGSFIYDFLIIDRCVSGATGAFLLFLLCKLSVMTALIFTLLRSEDFSYRFCELFSRCRHPFFEKQSVEYIKTMISTAGFAALINTIYLIFQSFSGISPL